MCGIVGYIGHRFAENILLAGLRRLEYRGYDSAGVAVLNGADLSVVKARGKIVALEEKLRSHSTDATLGIGHTRWATHGEPTEANAHPHTDGKGEIAVVHNGIIMNSAELRRQLEADGVVFHSETDTEVIPHLIAAQLKNQRADNLLDATRGAIEQLDGTYAIAVISSLFPDVIVCARKGSPLIIGLGENESFLASDASAVIQNARRIIYLKDGDLAAIRPTDCRIINERGEAVERPAVALKTDTADYSLGDFPHYMLKEIYEQPDVVQRILTSAVSEDLTVSLRARRNSTRSGRFGIEPALDERLEGVGRIILIACGTSWHAALVAKRWFEEIAGVPTEVDIASEYRYRNPILSGDTLCVVISQSGETADTLEGLRRARASFVQALAFVNVETSTIARESDGAIPLLAGPEIGVASTKAYIAQLTNLFLFSINLARAKNRLSVSDAADWVRKLQDARSEMAVCLTRRQEVVTIAHRFGAANNIIFLGRGYQVPTAMEAALKLKEISYIHATAYPAGEFKHGPIALIDIQTPTVAIIPNGSTFSRMASNVQEIKARKGPVILVTTDSAKDVEDLSPHVIRVPDAAEALLPLLTIIPLQLFAYEISVLRDCEVDRPRNLAKSVTVE
ncbi:MAG: glutamine--fructose-6-phosphate transaminase (isomerizing) [Planctomycetota bacterium]